MRSAHLEDSGDCIKRLLCELQSKKDQDLPWDEILIKKSVASKIDYMSPILQLQLAVDLGTKQGPKQCSVVYSRLVQVHTIVHPYLGSQLVVQEVNSKF